MLKNENYYYNYENYTLSAVFLDDPRKLYGSLLYILKMMGCGNCSSRMVIALKRILFLKGNHCCYLWNQVSSVYVINYERLDHRLIWGYFHSKSDQRDQGGAQMPNKVN